MKLIDYSLSVRNELLSNVNIEFPAGKICHLLGRNGSGKTCFAKSMLGIFPYTGELLIDSEKVAVIGSYTNIPLDLKVKDIVKLAYSKNKREAIDTLKEKLHMNNIPYNSKIKSLSDGQKQKVKLLYFLSAHPEVIVLDEFTNALDKKSCIDIYRFLSNYVGEAEDRLVLNITHNLSDLEFMAGDHYLIDDRKIKSGFSKEEIIDLYIRGGE